MAAPMGKPQEKNRRDKKKSRLYDVRTSAELSQRELAQLSGVSRNTIMRIENGDNIPNMDTCRKICAALNVTIGEVFDL